MGLPVDPMPGDENDKPHLRHAIVNDLTAFQALNRLIDTCRDGRFYEDYDESCELIGDAQDAIQFLKTPGHQLLR